MSDRVVIFIDYQNLYRATRACFHDHTYDPSRCGQVDPLALGELIVSRSVYDRTLHQVRVYRGLPSSRHDPRGYGAARSQIAAWSEDPRVQVFSRPLRYPRGWPDRCAVGEKPQEKGVDVALAIDFAAMAARKEYEVGILISLDTDLVPALEFVSSLQRAWGKPRAEVAAWSVDGHRNSRLSLPSHKLFCHWLKAEDYPAIRDDTDYTQTSVG